jgi:uncharacterized RDD family membrane protein YckC
MTQMPPTPQETPGTPVAGRPGELMDRFLARLVDGLFLGIAYWILSAVFASLFLRGLIHSAGEVLLYATFLSIFFVSVAIGYFAWFESNRGQTLGKQLLKLQVFGPRGGHPTMEQAVRRNIFYAAQLITIIPVVGWIVGPLASLALVIMVAVTINNDPVRRQGWHDQLAGGTYVLKVA